LSSERFINNDISAVSSMGKYGSHSRKRRKKRSILPVVIAVSAMLLFGLLFYFIQKDQFRNPYDLISRTDTLCYSAYTPEIAEAFAGDLSVIRKNNDADTENTAQTGLLCSDDGGDALYAKNVFSKMNPASTTKIMTCLLALENADLDKKITVGNEIYMNEAGVSLAGLKQGDTLTMEQLLYALMLPSGADAANAIAVSISGSIDRFAALMNDRAKKIGACQTHFSNAEGLTDPGHYTTCYDMYLILHEAVKNPEFLKIAGTSEYQASFTSADGSEAALKWTNTNLFLTGKAEEPSGMKAVAGKTGTTLAAGSCLALLSKTKDNRNYYSVILKADNRADLYSNMGDLLEKVPE